MHLNTYSTTFCRHTHQTQRRTEHCFSLKTLNNELIAFTGVTYATCSSADFTTLLLLDLRNVEEYDHSTTNLFDNFAIGISDRIPSWAMGLESFFNGKFSFVGGLLGRSQGFLPRTRRI